MSTLSVQTIIGNPNLSLSSNTIFSGNTTLANGSASAPSLAGFYYPYVGLFFPAANTLGFSTGGTERIRIDVNGKVGIGVTANVGKLQVANNIVARDSDSTGFALLSTGDATAGGYLATYNAAGVRQGYFGYFTGAHIQVAAAEVAGQDLIFSTYGGERFRVDSSGNVMIGRTTSTVGSGVKLDVNGGINAASVLINGAPAAKGTMQITVGTVAPSSNAIGDLWVDTN